MSQILPGRSTVGICLCCGGCGHSLDVHRALGQAVAHRDGPQQTFLSVLSADSLSQGPSIQKAIGVDLCTHREGNAGKMFHFRPRGHWPTPCSEEVSLFASDAKCEDGGRRKARRSQMKVAKPNELTAVMRSSDRLSL